MIRDALLYAMVLLVCLTSGQETAFAVGDETPVISAESEKKPVIEVGFSKGLLSVKAKDADIRAVVGDIAAKSGVEIVLDKTIVGKVAVEFQDIKFEEGLKMVLKDVVEGGFAGEYVRKGGAQGNLDLQKVVISRQSSNWPSWMKNVDEKDVLRINEMHVGVAQGKEVLFVKWGDKEGEIPVKFEIDDGKEYRRGFARLRIGEDGTIYFISWGHEKAWVYSKEGVLLKAIDLKGYRGTGFDVDHEGNIYLMVNPSRRDNTPTQEIIVYNKEFKQIEREWRPAVNGICATISEGILYDRCENGKVIHDYRYLLNDTSRHDLQYRFTFQLPDSLPLSDPLDEARPDVGMLFLKWANALGIAENNISAPYPQEWVPGSDGNHVIGYQGNKLYELIGISTKRRFYDDYGIAILDLKNKHAYYYRIPEKDSFVYENKELRFNWIRFDVDQEGNVYYLLTMKDGVHVYKYTLEVKP